MAGTLPRTRPTGPAPLAGAAEARVGLTAPWSLYQAIAEARGDRPSPRLSYLDGGLELMSPSFRHETQARRLGTFVLMLARGLRRPCLDAGSTRWESARLGKAKEPDGCFYLANEPAVRGAHAVDLETLPPPDLAVEVELSAPLNDPLRIYGALGVPEVWRYDGEDLIFWRLEAGGGYVESPESPAFPGLRPPDVLDWLDRADALDLTSWSVEVEDWARRTLPGP